MSSPEPSLKDSGSTTRSKYEDEEVPASYTVLIRTSSESTSEDPTGRISVLIRDEEGSATDKQVLRFSHTHPTPFQRGHRRGQGNRQVSPKEKNAGQQTELIIEFYSIKCIVLELIRSAHTESILMQQDKSSSFVISRGFA
uniref:Uncharacterized protein n=1 Tax=Caenorhabditis japonica TaxID=281687 RepID=A0A8R1EWT7_CAEJA